MIEITTKTKSDVTVHQVQFRNIAEFEKYLDETPFNNVFSDKSSRASDYGSEYFTGTKSYKQAVDMMHNGWEDKAKELDKKLKVVERDMAPMMKQQRVIGVAGYQPIVPLFLAGQPANMVSTVRRPVKQKVVTLVKSIAYPSRVSTSEWTEQGVKALAVVKDLERRGYRVNVDIVDGGYEGKTGFSCRVRVKSAAERLNVSKLAFLMCHPSSERRIFFRFQEVFPHITKDFKYSYGKPFYRGDMEQMMDTSKEYLVPTFIDDSFEKKMHDLKDLARYGK